MKKFIFGCTLMLIGAICGTGWLLAYSNLVQPGAWSTMLNIWAFNRLDGYVIILFYAISIFGAIIALKSIKDKK